MVLDLYPLVARKSGLPILRDLSTRRGAKYSELLERLDVSTATMSKTLRDLNRAGYVKREELGNAVFYSITEKGNRALQEFRDEGLLITTVADSVMARLDNMGLLDGRDPQDVKRLVEEEVCELVKKIEKRFSRE